MVSPRSEMLRPTNLISDSDFDWNRSSEWVSIYIFTLNRHKLTNARQDETIRENLHTCLGVHCNYHKRFEMEYTYFQCLYKNKHNSRIFEEKFVFFSPDAKEAAQQTANVLTTYYGLVVYVTETF